MSSCLSATSPGVQWRVLLLLVCTTILPITAGGQDTRDSVAFLAIDYPQRLRAGVPGVVEVRCRIVLRSSDAGIAMFGFNSPDAREVRMSDSVVLTRAVTDTILRLRVVPVSWQDEHGLVLLAVVGPMSQGARWSPTSRTRVPIAFQAGVQTKVSSARAGRARLERMAADSAGDSLFVSVVTSRASLQRGIPAEIELQIRTRLHAHMEADVRVLLNERHAREYATRADYRVQRGESFRSVRLTVVPVDWRPDNPFGVLVVLVADPASRAISRSILRLVVPLEVSP